MTDAQLWLSAFLFQGLRFILPLGNVFTPILHRVIEFVTTLESDKISKVSFYKETTAFVLWLQRRGFDVQVTGHSLGGGLALITGSQAGVATVGMSAPNAILSRDTFDPPLTIEQLNTFTLNVVPARDLVPMIDDKAMLYQNINCTADRNDIAGCHSIVRSLCEIQFSCGSDGRPVLCECVLDYKYDEPTPIGNVSTSFKEACAIAQNQRN
eukprot:scaffold14313_cov200-Alexandrium_tamarense.AAC.9